MDAVKDQGAKALEAAPGVTGKVGTYIAEETAKIKEAAPDAAEKVSYVQHLLPCWLDRHSVLILLTNTTLPSRLQNGPSRILERPLFLLLVVS